MRRIGIVAAFLALGVAKGEDSPDEARMRKVRELIDLTGAADSVDNLVEFICPRAADAAELRRLLPRDQILARVVPIYAKRFDDETLDATLAFLRSPAGKKYVTSQATAHREAVQAVVAWKDGASEAHAKCKEYFDTAMCWRTMSDTKKFPESLEQMEAPIRPGEEKFIEVVLDPWGHKYVLRMKDGKPTVVCFGPDGVEGTPDDIAYPDR